MHFNLSIIMIAALAIVSFTVSASASYTEALKLFQEKNYKDSIKKISEELNTADDFKQGSPNYNLRYLAAHALWKLGNRDTASIHLRKCMEIKKDSVDPYIDLAMILIESKKLIDAEKIARKAQSMSESPMVYYILGKINLISRNYAKAIENFEKANSINPDLYISYNDLGIALLGLKKTSQANTAFSIANELNSHSPEILNNLAVTYEKLGNNKKALEFFLKAGEFDINNPVILKNIARVKARKQN